LFSAVFVRYWTVDSGHGRIWRNSERLASGLEVVLLNMFRIPGRSTTARLGQCARDELNAKRIARLANTERSHNA
jgi:hypothetical protein